MQAAFSIFGGRFEAEEEKGLTSTAGAVAAKKAQELADKEGISIEEATAILKTEREKDVNKEKKPIDLGKYPEIAFPLGEVKTMVKRAFKYLFTTKKVEIALLRLLVSSLS
jgi:hypothetical protein